jgi:diguanylate cyclase (GGDEF)-like protein
VVDVVGLSFGLAIPVTATLVMKLFQVRTLNKILEDTASRDPLTGCLNRRALVAAVEKLMGRTPEPGGPIQGAFLLIDADHFKHINDRLGHVAGDAALQMIAAAIRSAVRDTDIVARVGGEEFVAFLPGVDPESARQIAERIVLTVNSTPFAASGGSARLAVSVGGATFDHSVPFDRLYRQADDRLYQAKESGRNKAITAPLAA